MRWKYSAWITAVVFIAHYFSSFLEGMVVEGNQLAWLYLFAWYTVFIAIGDKMYKVIK